MQDISIGIQRLQQPLGTAKENCLLRGAVKARPVPTASQSEGVTCALSSASELMEVTPLATEEEEDLNVPDGPLPQLSWANSRDLWVQMRAKDVSKTAPEQELLSLHPGILPSMRTILFDWLMEVGTMYVHVCLYMYMYHTCTCICMCVTMLMVYVCICSCFLCGGERGEGREGCVHAQ